MKKRPGICSDKLYAGEFGGTWCPIISLVGLLLSDWALPVRRLVSEPGESEDCPGRSSNKWHTYGVLLMGAEDLFVDSDSGREFHPQFFIAGDGESLACGNGGRWRRGSQDASDVDLLVNLLNVRVPCFGGWL